jgi:tRNA-dihydrouridine synthase 3
VPNVVKDDATEYKELNNFSFDLRKKLDRRQYKFGVLAATKKESAATVSDNAMIEGTAVLETGSEPRAEKKQIDWCGKTYLAPLTTVGNLPFRRVCKSLGVDITCSEMAMADSVVRGQVSEMALLRRHESEDLFGIQVLIFCNH